jgi:minichromosome maintenance protein 10
VAPRSQENGGGGATYIIGGGGIVNTNRTDGGLRGLGDEHLGEKLGRRRAEKRKKRDEERETEEALKRLMARDGAAQSTGGKYLTQIGVEVGGKKAKKGGDEGDGRKRAFSAQAIKRIGFDPTLPVGGRGPEDRGKRVSFCFLVSTHIRSRSVDQEGRIHQLAQTTRRTYQAGQTGWNGFLLSQSAGTT